MRRPYQILVLLVGSAIFYSWENPRLLLLLFFSCMLNALSAERIIFHRRTNLNQRKAKQWVTGAVAINLLLLSFFKYAKFVVVDLLNFSENQVVVEWLTTIPLPVGISFFTFQGISLLIDLQRGQVSEQTEASLRGGGTKRLSSIADVSFYISFFPQLVAGPIVKAHDFFDQIGGKRLSGIDWLTVRRSLVLGYFLKVFVADNLSEQTVVLTLGADFLGGKSTISCLCLLYAYSFQIFADFAGYSLIAIGLATLFGYRLPINFNFPYLSVSITEFWRRWHISLSEWLRDYLYFPLGGNRKGAKRTYLNLFLVMFLGGLWHGAAWKFAIWGTLHGSFLAVERLFGQAKKPALKKNANAGMSLVKWFVTFNAVTFVWLTFMMPDLASISVFLTNVIAMQGQFSGSAVFALLFYGFWVVIYHLWGWVKEHREAFAQKLSGPRWEGALHGLLLFLLVTNPGAPRGFIYFQF